MMKKAIVSGATGFIGEALVRCLVEQGVEVTALCHDPDAKRVSGVSPVHYRDFDLISAQELLTSVPAGDYDVFYHFAWAGSAGQSRTDVALQLNNAKWAVDCLRVAKELGCKRFVCAGSIMEHETVAAAYTQGNRPGLAYIYGGAKLVAHVMCMSVAADLGIDLVWAKITNAYGPGEKSPRLINTTLRKCLAGEQPHFTSGTQNYDFVYIDDVARAFYLIGDQGKPFNDYLIGSSSARPLKEFLLEMKEAIAPDLDFVFGDVPFTGIDLPLSAFDCSATVADTGFRAEIGFAEGIRRTFEWIRRQELR
jgi:nucleoside-diphosphate-sugar epimerase